MAIETSDFADRTGLSGYVGKVRLFSRNARLYLLHIFGMDVIHGTWEVLFNLYLLAAGFDIAFIGLRLAVQGVAGALMSVPAGRLADRIDRKWGFIIGDGGGALAAVVLISTMDPTLILVASGVSAGFGAMHYVTESPFIAENSEPAERLHLFSVGSGFRTLAAMLGALTAGFLPGWLRGQYGLSDLGAFRWATYLGIAWWFASLIPAVKMRRYVSEEVAAARADGGSSGIAGLRNPVVVFKFVTVGALLSLGGGFVLRLTNVFLVHDAHAHENEVGLVFAAGSLVLAVSSLLAPLAVERFGRMRTIWVTRLAAIPFIFLLGFAPSLASPTRVVSLAGLAFVLRTGLFNMSGPVYEAVTMEMLHPTERATFTGLGAFFGSGLSAVASYFGASLMDGGDFRTPFVIMAVAYALSTWLFYRWFAVSDVRVMATER